MLVLRQILLVATPWCSILTSASAPWAWPPIPSSTSPTSPTSITLPPDSANLTELNLTFGLAASANLRELHGVNTTPNSIVGRRKEESTAAAAAAAAAEVESTAATSDGDEEENEHGGEEDGDSEHGEGEGDLDEHEMKRYEYDISVMLLGAIVVAMLLFIATNMRDDDMRFYAWKVISQTISILVAVMMFTSINDFMHTVVLKGRSHRYQILWDLAQCIIYNVTMQVIVAACIISEGEAELRMRSYGQLMAHSSAFAAIDFGGCMQQGDLFDVEGSPLLRFVAPLAMAMLLWLFCVAMRLSRGCIAKKFIFHEDSPICSERTQERDRGLKTVYHNVPQEDDHESDVPDFAKNVSVHVRESSQGPVKVPRKRGLGTIYVAQADHQSWEATIYEAENDVSALCVSFLLVQALRGSITGIMPDEMGEEYSSEHTLLSIQLFGVCAVVFMLLALVMEVISSKLFTSDHLADMASMHQGFSWEIFFFLLGKRCVLVGAQACAMGMAWCILCNFQWMMTRWCPGVGSPATIAFKILLALLISSASFFIVLFLDKISDSDKFEDKAFERMIDRSIIKVIMALGILIGFAWEHAFNRAVEVVVEVVPLPELLKNPAGEGRLAGHIILEMVGTMAMTSLVVFSWRRYILIKVLNLEHIREQNDRAH